MNEVLSIEDQYNMRKLLYDNKDTFYKIDEIESDNESDNDKTELKEINESIIKGSQLLKTTLNHYNELNIENKKLYDIKNKSKKYITDIDFACSQLKNLTINNNIKIDNFNDSMDQINYLLLDIIENVESNLNNKKKDIEIAIKNDKSILKTLSKSYNILQNTNVNYTCPVCMVNQVNMFLQPCGHSMCKECIFKSSTCYFCRSHIVGRAKIYYML
jgi:hypothetical protein